MSGGETRIERNGVAVEGYLAEPEGTPRAGVVVIQEAWGLNDDIRGIADRFAAEGYLAFAPDLYDGKTSEEPEEATKLAMALERDVVAAEIDGVIAWLKEERGVARAGCIGFCMGGGLTLATAIRPTSHVDAVHVFYGGGMPREEAIARIRVPVMGSYGSLDEGIPAEQVDLLRATLEANGVANDVKLYDGAHHGFFNDTRDVYDQEASGDAWRRTLGWFEHHLHT